MKKTLLKKKISFEEGLDLLIKACMRNHIVAYNYALELLINSRENKTNIDLKTLRKKVMEYVKDNKLYPIIKLSLHVEIYYLYKKFTNGIKKQKNISDIQYLTFLINDIDRGFIRINIGDRDYIRVKFNELLTEPEVEIVKEEVTLINLSYSNIKDEYMLSVFN